VSESIVLIGLPGSGKKRFQRVFRQAYPQAKMALFPFGEESEIENPGWLKAQVWCVIDVRSPLLSASAELHLKALIQQSTAVVLSFVASADLSAQVFWQDWLKKNDRNRLPRKRWQGLDRVDAEAWLSLSEPISSTSLNTFWQQLKPLKQLSIALGDLSASKPFYLEHLMMVLDAARNNLAMDIWRVQGCLLTHEYAHAVAIEMTASRCDFFAADTQIEQAYLEVLGCHFDQAWLQQAIEASQL